MTFIPETIDDSNSVADAFEQAGGTAVLGGRPRTDFAEETALGRFLSFVGDARTKGNRNGKRPQTATLIRWFRQALIDYGTEELELKPEDAEARADDLLADLPDTELIEPAIKDAGLNRGWRKPARRRISRPDGVSKGSKRKPR